MNLFIVIGPSITNTVNESNQIFAAILNGKLPVIMGLAWGYVDVRDAARAHVRALTAANAKGRYLCAAKTCQILFKDAHRPRTAVRSFNDRQRF